MIDAKFFDRFAILEYGRIFVPCKGSIARQTPRQNQHRLNMQGKDDLVVERLTQLTLCNSNLLISSSLERKIIFLTNILEQSFRKRKDRNGLPKTISKETPDEDYCKTIRCKGNCDSYTVSRTKNEERGTR